MKRPIPGRTSPNARLASTSAAGIRPDEDPKACGPPDQRRPPGSLPVRWSPAPRARSLATAALLALPAAILTGHAALVLQAAPALGALALMPRRRPPEKLAVDVTLPGSRCFEGKDVTITATIRAPGGRPLDEITIELETAQPVTLTSGTGTQTFLEADVAMAQWAVRPGR